MCQKKHTAKHDFAVYYIFAVCAHGKKIVWRVPNRKHTANYRAHGKEPDYGSATEHAGWNMGNPLEVILFFHLIKLLFNEFIKDGFFQLNSVLVTLVINHFMNNLAFPSLPVLKPALMTPLYITDLNPTPLNRWWRGRWSSVISYIW